MAIVNSVKGTSAKRQDNRLICKSPCHGEEGYNRYYMVSAEKGTVYAGVRFDQDCKEYEVIVIGFNPGIEDPSLRRWVYRAKMPGFRTIEQSFVSDGMVAQLKRNLNALEPKIMSLTTFAAVNILDRNLNINKDTTLQTESSMFYSQYLDDEVRRGMTASSLAMKKLSKSVWIAKDTLKPLGNNEFWGVIHYVGVQPPSNRINEFWRVGTPYVIPSSNIHIGDSINPEIKISPAFDPWR